MGEARDKAAAARAVMRQLASAPDDQRRRAADAIEARKADVLAANARDMERARANGMSLPLQDRLMLDEDRLASICAAMREVASQHDPLGRVLDGGRLDSGVRLERVTVPLGVIAMVYEARPNVTADAFALCMRAGNACILRGGSAAHDSCETIAQCCREGVEAAGLPGDCVSYISSEGHEQTDELMRASGLVDVLIPRGGASLIKACVENATVPVIETGTGNCHIYLEKSAQVDMAVDIVINAKCSRPGVCNAAESLLVDEEAAERLLPPVLEALAERGVELVGDARSCKIAHEQGIDMAEASEEDFATEFLDLKISVACVDGVEAAIEHVNAHGTGHSEAIVTQDYAAAERFLAGVDAAAVYCNASTRFTDGGVFGLGAEIGISTQRLHVRGPMGADALTTTKYLIRGEGQIR